MRLFFKAISKIMSTDFPSKPRRKKLEVAVHKAGDETKRSADGKKTFSANFHSKKYRARNEDKSPKAKEINEIDSISQKFSRKYLVKENTRLLKENEDVIIKFNELEELSVRKILKLKEKISSLHALNEDIIKENNDLKAETRELLTTIEDYRIQIAITEHCKSCEEFKITIDKISNENTILRKAKKDTDDDLNMLKTVVYRLNVQMERYQEKMRTLDLKMSHSSGTPQHQVNNIPIVDGHDPNIFTLHQDHSHTPISWGKVNIHTLGPLLDAYQDTINEKDEIIESYETEISNFTGKLKEVLKENEMLQKSLTEDADSSVKLKEEMDGLRKELQVLRDQNDVLIKKCAVKQDQLAEVLKCYNCKVEQLKRDYSVVHEQYCKSRTEVSAVKEKYKALEEVQNEFKNERQNYIPLSVHTSSVNECKKLYEELKFQYEQERVKLKENIDEFQKQIAACCKEKEEMTVTIKHLERQSKKSESRYLDLEHRLSEVQFARSACKKQLHKAMNFAKDLVSEQETLINALNQRQQENKVVKKLECNMATKMDSLRNQLKDVQRDAWQELTTVEKRIQDQDDAMETMKQEHSEEIQRLQEIIREQENNLLLKERGPLPSSHYLLYRDKHKN